MLCKVVSIWPLHRTWGVYCLLLSEQSLTSLLAVVLLCYYNKLELIVPVTSACTTAVANENMKDHSEASREAGVRSTTVSVQLFVHVALLCVFSMRWLCTGHWGPQRPLVYHLE